MTITEENTIGLDLGTTFSTGAYADSNGEPVIACDENGNSYIPSVVCGYSLLLVGSEAERQKSRYLKSTVYEFKRLVAKNYDDPEVQKLYSHWPFEVVADKKNHAAFKLLWQGEERVIPPEEFYNYLVEYICKCAEKKTGRQFRNIVLTVPATFNSNQRTNIKNAVETTGRRVIDIIAEPTAAVISYCQDERLDGKHVLVYDFGGGTFDVSILHVKDNHYDILKEDGDPQLGGSDINEHLFRLFAGKIQERTGVDVESDAKAAQRVRAYCDSCKIALSQTETWEDMVDISPLEYEGGDGKMTKELEMTISRAEMNEVIRDVLEKTIAITKRCIENAGLKESEIDVIAMIGGSSSIVYAKEMLRGMFPSSTIADYGDPRSAVARGAMLWGLKKAKEEKATNVVLMKDATPIETVVVNKSMTNVRITDEGGSFVVKGDADGATNVVLSSSTTNVRLSDSTTNVRLSDSSTKPKVIAPPIGKRIARPPVRAKGPKTTNVVISESPAANKMSASVSPVASPAPESDEENPAEVSAKQSVPDESLPAEPVAVVPVETSSKMVVEPTTNVVVEPATNVAVEATTNVAVDPTTNVVVEPVTNVAVEPSTNVIVEPTTNVAVEPTTNVAVESTTNVVVEPTPDVPDAAPSLPTEPASGEMSSKMVAEPTTSEPVDPSVTAPVEPVPDSLPAEPPVAEEPIPEPERPVVEEPVPEPTPVEPIEELPMVDEPTPIPEPERPVVEEPVPEPTPVEPIEELPMVDEPTPIPEPEPAPVETVHESTVVAAELPSVTEEPTQTETTVEPTEPAPEAVPDPSEFPPAEPVGSAEPSTNVTLEQTTNVTVEPTTNVTVEPTTNVTLEPTTNVAVTRSTLVIEKSPSLTVHVPQEACSIVYSDGNYVRKSEQGDVQTTYEGGSHWICNTTRIVIESDTDSREVTVKNGSMDLSVENGELKLSSNDDMLVSRTQKPSRDSVGIARSSVHEAVNDNSGEARAPEQLPDTIISRCNLDVGIACADDVFSTLIREGTPLPATMTKKYRAAPTTPQMIGIDVFQGKSALCSNNDMIAQSNVGPLNTSKGLGEIILEMTINVSGIVQLRYKQPFESYFHPLPVYAEVKKDPNEIRQLKKQAEITRDKDRRRARFNIVRGEVKEMLRRYHGMEGSPSYMEQQYVDWKQWIKDHDIANNEIPSNATALEWEQMQKEMRSIVDSM